ncbi:MAG: hypothetical protein AB1450_15190 [Pseudomonadota bacterium]
MTGNDLLTILFSPPLLGALLIYGLVVMVLEYFTARLHHAVQDVGFTAWMVEHVLLPWCRVLALLLFLLLAYPRVFGLDAAPPMPDLLWAHDGRVSTLINTAFVLSLLLPLAPLLGNLKGLVLPVQAIAMSTLLFHWLTVALNVKTVSYWPGATVVVTILLLAPLTQSLAHHVSHWIGGHINRLHNREGFESLLYEGLLLFFQVPAVLIYTLALGRQLHGVVA